MGSINENIRDLLPLFLGAWGLFLLMTCLRPQRFTNSFLLDACIRDAKAQNRKGLCIFSSARKKEFLADPKYLHHKGFTVADESDNGITLFICRFAQTPKSPDSRIAQSIRKRRKRVL